jgi:hypothetical protein
MQCIRRGKLIAHTSRWFLRSGSFPKISDRACKGLHANASREQCFHVPNARQSETFCDIVLVIDAYRLSPTLDPEDALHPRRPA